MTKHNQNYLIEVHETPLAIPAPAWNSLLSQQAEPTPFMRHEFLAALHRSESACEATGWRPQFVTVKQSDRLIAAAPVYLKQHSWGEYVFDWAWAQAYQRHGLSYYPKLVVAVPFTPVTGSRLMAVDELSQQVLLSALRELTQHHGASSAHLLFPTALELQTAQQARWMRRQGIQFHWQNRMPEAWSDFEAFLADMQREKRKKIKQERRKVQEAGVRLRTLEGRQITAEDWQYFYRCYVATYQAHGGAPYLSWAFFEEVAQTMACHWLMVVAECGGERVAASLVAIDRSLGCAWGRYWGSTTSIPCLHFEACYYQPLAWCIAEQFRRFEGGAQGEHKMARGLMPSPTGSMHWVAHPGFAEAIADFLQQEVGGVDRYLDELSERSPIKATSTPCVD